MNKFVAAVMLSSVLVGCGGSFCEQFRDKMEAKTKNCAGLAGFTTDDYVSQCEEGLKSCTDTDKKELDDGLKCVDTQPVCVSGQDFQYGISVLVGCFGNRNISDACRSSAF